MEFILFLFRQNSYYIFHFIHTYLIFGVLFRNHITFLSFTIYCTNFSFESHKELKQVGKI